MRGVKHEFVRFPCIPERVSTHIRSRKTPKASSSKYQETELNSMRGRGLDGPLPAPYGWRTTGSPRPSSMRIAATFVSNSCVSCTAVPSKYSMANATLSRTATQSRCLFIRTSSINVVVYILFTCTQFNCNELQSTALAVY